MFIYVYFLEIITFDSRLRYLLKLPKGTVSSSYLASQKFRISLLYSDTTPGRSHTYVAGLSLSYLKNLKFNIFLGSIGSQSAVNLTVILPRQIESMHRL